MPALIEFGWANEVDFLAFEDQFSAIALDDTAQHVDQSGLSGAVLAHQGVHLARTHIEIHVFQGVHAAKTLGDTLDL